jgi:hypothetical protein
MVGVQAGHLLAVIGGLATASSLQAKQLCRPERPPVRVPLEVLPAAKVEVTALVAQWLGGRVTKWWLVVTEGVIRALLRNQLGHRGFTLLQLHQQQAET